MFYIDQLLCNHYNDIINEYYYYQLAQIQIQQQQLHKKQISLLTQRSLINNQNNIIKMQQLDIQMEQTDNSSTISIQQVQQFPSRILINLLFHSQSYFNSKSNHNPITAIPGIQLAWNSLFQLNEHINININSNLNPSISKCTNNSTSHNINIVLLWLHHNLKKQGENNSETNVGVVLDLLSKYLRDSQQYKNEQCRTSIIGYLYYYYMYSQAPSVQLSLQTLLKHLQTLPSPDIASNSATQQVTHILTNKIANIGMISNYWYQFLFHCTVALYRDVSESVEAEDRVLVGSQEKRQQLRKQWMEFVRGFRHCYAELVQEFVLQPTNIVYAIIKNIMETIPFLMPQQETKQNIITQLRTKYLKSYQNYLISLTSNPTLQPLHPQKSFPRLKLLQLFHIADPTFNLSQFVLALPSRQLKMGKQKYSVFMKHELYACLTDFQTKGANALGFNVYGAIAKEIGGYDISILTFGDVYLMLDCYGMHLIKDIWDRFYILCQQATSANPPPPLYPVSTLLHILLTKVSQHPNSNVPKYCIQSLLSSDSQQTAPLFQHEDLQDMVYGSLVQILNSGTHYNDCTHFHMDSKIYGLVKSFYLGGYKAIRSGLREHVGKLVMAMEKFITFQHCLMAYIGIFAQLHQIPRQSQQKLLQRPQIQTLLQLSNRMLPKLCFRKRFRANECILTCLEQNLNIRQLGLKWIINMVMNFSISLLDVKSKVKGRARQIQQFRVPRMFQIVTRWFSCQQIGEYIDVLMQSAVAKQHQLIKCQDLHIQQHQQRVQDYKRMVRQITILSLIQSTSQNPKSNQTPTLRHFSQLICNIQTLSQSSYSHPLQSATCLYSISTAVTYSSAQYTNKLFSVSKGNINSDDSQGKWAADLLLLISKMEDNKLVDFEHVRQCLRVVACGIKQSNQHHLCRSYAKLIQYCILRIRQCNIEPNGQTSNQQEDRQAHTQYYTKLLVLALKYKQAYTKTYKSLQSCLYTLYQTQFLLSIDQGQKQTQPKLNISPKYRLRVQFLLFSILCNDPKYALKTVINNWSYVSQLGQYANLYDYQYTQQYFGFCLSLATLLYKAHQNNRVQAQKYLQFESTIFSHLKQSIKTMLHNLDYGVHKKQVMSACQTVVRIAIILNFNQEAIDAVKYLIDIGDNYWGFQRCTVFLLIKLVAESLRGGIKRIADMRVGLIQLLKIFICIQQYRGQDSSILLAQFNNFPLYRDQKMHTQSDYDGTSIRFIVIDWIKQHLDQICSKSRNMEQTKESLRSQLKQNVQFWSQFFEQCLQICVAECGKQRMFMTGSHKTKLKFCQILPIYANYVVQIYQKQVYYSMVLRIVDALSLNNLIQIKHYLETFLIKVIYLRHDQQLLQSICEKLCEQLLCIDGQNTVLRNVSYMVISGLILQVKYHHKLFNILFAFICSHVAYYRGITQYFCYKIQQPHTQTQSQSQKYLKILHNEYLKDQDAIKLNEKLHKIIQNYKQLIKSWNIYDHLFVFRPTLNGQVVSEDHYIDKIKYLGTQLVRELKSEDGFMPEKDRWKALVTQKEQNTGLPNMNNIISQKQISKQQTKQPQQTSFQRKIDPSLADIYNFQAIESKKKVNNNIKVFVISAQYIAFYGHMARIGEIFGIKQLCIPSLKILDQEDFYNVSVTAEKWLNITQHGYQKVKIKKDVINIGKQPKNKKNNNKQQQKKQKDNKNSKKQLNSIKVSEKTIKKQDNKSQMVDRQQKIQYQQINKQNLLSLVRKNIDQGYKIYKIAKGRPKTRDQSKENLKDRIGGAAKKSLLIVDELGYLDKQPIVQNMIEEYISYDQFYSYHVQATIFIWEYFKQFVIKN